MTTYSQASQDIFVYKIMNEKYNGTFVEIGTNHPIHNNNTYILETKYKWKGLLVEYDKSFEGLYNSERPNSIYLIQDATQVDYKLTLDENKFPKNIDYLQVDLDVNNKSTIDTIVLLDNTLFEHYKFATVTIEHDIYTGNFFNTQSISREILNKRGYILVFPNVSVFWCGEYKPFEDWYVHPDLVNMDYVNSIKTDKSLTCDEIKNILLE